jgi:hypothetical protein
MSLNDSAVLSVNVMFQNRVQMAMIAACIAIASELTSVLWHEHRVELVHAILSSPTSVNNYTTMFSQTAATDSTVLGDATVGGTVALTTANAATQQALITDAHINAAVSGQFYAFAQRIPV